MVSVRPGARVNAKELALASFAVLVVTLLPEAAKRLWQAGQLHRALLASRLDRFRGITWVVQGQRG